MTKNTSSDHFLIKKSDYKDFIKIMKTCLLFLFVFTFQLMATDSKAQNAVIVLESNTSTVIQLINQIEKQTDYLVVYSNREVDTNRKINFKNKSNKVSAYLDEAFSDTDIGYNFENDYIVLSKRAHQNAVTLSQAIQAVQQSRTVIGKVTDENDEPIIGATIVVKDSPSQGTITDIDGNFVLSNLSENAILHITYVGMKSQEINTIGRTSINVTMEADMELLDEIVVVGYGTQKKSNLTGAVGVATSKRLENRPITSVGHGLQGIIPNLNISISDGDPTTRASYNIRGFESITGGQPLILVDGVPMELDMINPNDIASVNVLKDASSAAVYGARAAFGVILVETKRGREGLTVSFGSEISFATPIFKLNPVSDPYVFATWWNKAHIRTYGYPDYDENMIEGAKRWSENPTDENAWGVYNGELRFYGNNDYQKQLLSDFAPQQKYDFSISGATDRTSFYVSLGYLNKDGYINEASHPDQKDKNLSYQRYNILMQANYKVTDWMSVDPKIIFNLEKNDEPHIYTDVADLNSVIRVDPLKRITFPDLPYYLEPGDREKYEQFIGFYYEDARWLNYLRHGGRDTQQNVDSWLSQGITLTPIAGFIIRSDFSYNLFTRQIQEVHSKAREEVAENLFSEPMLTNARWSADDWIANQYNHNEYFVFNAYAEYSSTRFDNHYFKVMGGFNQEWGQNNQIRTQARSLVTPEVTDINATTGAQQISGGKSHVGLRGTFYRLNYIFQDKYLFETNGRYDLTSRFPKKNRADFFPSFSAGWRISNEGFMDSTNNWLTNLMVRASYGSLGNQLLGSNYYPYIPSMGMGFSSFVLTSGRTPYVTPPGLVSSDLTWETVTTKNIGLDILFDRRFEVSADFYTRETFDMLMRKSYPSVLGASSPQANAANLKTTGWEVNITWRDWIGQDWEYGINVALSDNESIITKYENPTDNINDYYVGHKVGEIWGFETVGIFQSDEDVVNAPDQSEIGSNWRAGDIQYADLNDDGKITRGSQTLDDPGDLRIIGNSSPRYSFGINTDLSYKNWTLNIFFQGLFRDFNPDLTSHVIFFPYNSKKYVDEYMIKDVWSEENRDAYFPYPHMAYEDKKNSQIQTRYLQNASFVRLKNLTLNYNLPAELINKIGMSKAQIFFSGMNLWEFSKIHHSLDPEIANLRQEYYMQRIYSLGVKVSF